MRAGLDSAWDEIGILKERHTEFWDQCAVLTLAAKAAGTRGQEDDPRMLLWRDAVCMIDASLVHGRKKWYW